MSMESEMEKEKDIIKNIMMKKIVVIMYMKENI